MAVIYLIRHGQASLGSDNYDQLSELGIKQSQCLGNALKNRGLQFDAVYRGSMKRHAQTAEHCLASMGCESAPVNLNAGFNEYNHEEVIERYRPEFADHSNLAQFLASQPQPRKAFQLVFESALERWRQGEHDHEYSETWNQFQARCVDALNYVRHHSGDAKSIATHPATTTHQRLTEDQRAELGIGPGLIRLSVGLEDAGDLIADLEGALSA